MSVRADSANDNLLRAEDPGLTTGAFSWGLWVKLISDTNAYTDLLALGSDALDPATYFAMYLSSNGVTARSGWFDSTGCGAYDLAVGTWYWLVASRSGDTSRLRVFDDSTSTTPLADATEDVTGRSASGYDNFVLGRMFTGDTPDAEFANCKFHLGVAWTDAQCRTESQLFEIQTGGGTKWGSWRLESTAADANGINDGSGGGHSLTNSGMANGASRPTQLAPVIWGPQLGMRLNRLVQTT